MANESMGLLARKLGMTQIYGDDGEMIPVTVLEAGPCSVLQVKTSDTKDGYNAIQLGIGSQKVQRVTKASLGHFAKSGKGESPSRFVREIRLSKDDAAKYEAGQALGVNDVFTESGKVDVTGTSKGKGFGGVMKKYNFKGFIRSHGTHEFFRHGGSIGTRLTPGFVFKGKKMPGQMGNKQVTVQNLRIARIDTERNLLMVAGGVPGPTGSYLVVRTAVK